jgi:hypothetical protein
MKKIIKLTERDLTNIVRGVIYESTSDREKYEYLKNSLDRLKNSYNEIIQYIEPMKEFVKLYDNTEDNDMNIFIELFDNEEFPRDMISEVGGEYGDMERKVKRIKRCLKEIDPNGDLTN